MNARSQRANQIMETEGYCSQINYNSFSVRSQTNPKNYYTVTKTGNGLICECPDHTTRKSDCKHIKIALDFIKNNEGRKQVFRIIERSLIKVCKYCDSGRIRKDGFRKKKSGRVRIFECLDCKKKFTVNFGFESMRYDENIITGGIANVLFGNVH